MEAGGEEPGAESEEEYEEDDDSPLEAFLLRPLVAFLFDDPVSFCGENTLRVKCVHDFNYLVTVTIFPKESYFAVLYLNISLGLVPLLHALVAVPHLGNAVAPLEVGARDVDPGEARVALDHRPPGVGAVAVASDEILCGEIMAF